MLSSQRWSTEENSQQLDSTYQLRIGAFVVLKLGVVPCCGAFVVLKLGVVPCCGAFVVLKLGVVPCCGAFVVLKLGVVPCCGLRCSTLLIIAVIFSPFSA